MAFRYNKKMKNNVVVLLCVLVMITGTMFYKYGRYFPTVISQHTVGKRTVQDVVALYGDPALNRLKPLFEAAAIDYPPKEVVFLAIKDIKKLEVWASNGDGFRYVHSYSIQKTSGVAGPKLREGDRQVPEGIYRISGLNPNSAYHLSMKLNYPNTFDSRHAQQEGRTSPGSNIFIHGKSVSIGCLAMGDTVIEELFILTENIGKEHVKVVIAPYDPRQRQLTVPEGNQLSWLKELYREIEGEYLQYQ